MEQSRRNQLGTYFFFLFGLGLTLLNPFGTRTGEKEKQKNLRRRRKFLYADAIQDLIAMAEKQMDEEKEEKLNIILMNS